MVDLYCKRRPSKISNLGEMVFVFKISKKGWYSFFLQGKHSKRLSRGQISLLYSGSHHTLLRHIFLIQCDFGWKLDDTDKVYQRILTTNLPVLESIIELNFCKHKSGCNCGRYWCQNISLVCLKMCLFQNCQNCVEHKMPHWDENYEQ